MRTNLQSIQRCPWCWNFLIHLAIKQALEALWIEKENVVFVTWIWCGSKMNQYVDCYWAETLHGRGIGWRECKGIKRKGIERNRTEKNRIEAQNKSPIF